MNSDAKALKARGDQLFSKKRSLDSRNQCIADHFYVERADFTVSRSLGDDFAEHLMTGYPALVRRDLGNSIGSMLRPKQKHWFEITIDGIDDHAGKEYLEWMTGVQRRAMRDRAAKFSLATKQGDHDFAAFGGCVISVQFNPRAQAMLYRNWHLRDVAWSEDAYGDICEVHRNWMTPTAADLVQIFGDKVHSKVAAKAADPKKATETVKCRHIIISAERYDATKRWRTPWVSLFIDCENEHLMEERGEWTRVYAIPRWATVSGSQYPFSPATVIALPDARLLQAMTLSLLDAGERVANPPMIGVAEAIRGDLNIFPGGFTAVDAQYDERLGEVLRPLHTDARGLPFGLDQADAVKGMLREAFYLNTLTLPPHGGPDMTAYEAGQRVQEYIRQALPLFEPMEDGYNGELCEMTTVTLMRNGAFGSPGDIPDSIAGRDLEYRFESPLSEAVERQKGQLFLEGQAIISSTAQADPGVLAIMDFETTLRDVLEGIGMPAKWMNSPEDVAARRQQEAQMQALQQAAAVAQQGAQTAVALGQARQALAPTEAAF